MLLLVRINQVVAFAPNISVIFLSEFTVVKRTINGTIPKTNAIGKKKSIFFFFEKVLLFPNFNTSYYVYFCR